MSAQDKNVKVDVHVDDDEVEDLPKGNPKEAKDADEAYNLASVRGPQVSTEEMEEKRQEALERAEKRTNERYKDVDLDAAMRPESGATIPQQGEALNRKIMEEEDGKAVQISEEDIRAEIDPRPSRRVIPNNAVPFDHPDKTLAADTHHAGDATAPGKG